MRVDKKRANSNRLYSTLMLVFIAHFKRPQQQLLDSSHYAANIVDLYMEKEQQQNTGKYR